MSFLPASFVVLDGDESRTCTMIILRSSWQIVHACTSSKTDYYGRGMHILIFEIREKLFHNYNNYDCIYQRGVEEAVTTGEKLALGGLNS